MLKDSAAGSAAERLPLAATEIKNLVKTGSVDPAKGTGPNHSVFKTWQAAALSQMAAGAVARRLARRPTRQAG